MSFISPRAIIEPGTFIGEGVTIYGPAHIRRGTVIEDYCIIGKPSRVQLTRFRELMQHSDRPLTTADYDSVVDTPVIIGENVTLHSQSTIYAGCTLAEGVILEDKCVIRWDTTIGAHTKLMVGGFFGSYITIGSHCRVGGTLGNRSVIGNYVTSFGSYVHDYIQYGANRVEAAPHIEDRVTIGFDSIVIGGVRVGEGSYALAGTLISKDVPPHTVVKNRNEHTPMKEWRGQLAELYAASFPDAAFRNNKQDGTV